MKKLIQFLLFFSCIIGLNKVHSQTTIWSVDFETGYSDNDETAQDNNLPTGPDWTKSGTPTDWWRVESNNAISGSRSMQAKETDGVMTWTSEAIDISGYTNVSISLDLEEINWDNGGSDQMETFYDLGSGNVEFGDGNGDGEFTSVTNTVSGLNVGGELVITVTINCNANNERGRFDNIVVSGTPLSHSGPGGVGDNTGAGELELWLQAEGNTYTDAGVTAASDGNNIQQWNDISGNGNHASEATNQPNLNTNSVNGFSTLTFSGGNDRIASTGISTANHATVFTVFQINTFSANSNDGIIHAGPSGNSFSTSGSDKVIGMWVNVSSGNIWGRGVQSNSTSQSISQVTSLSTGQYYAISQEYDGSDVRQYVNGTTAGSVSYDGTLRSWTDFGIGRQGSESLNGEIAEVIAFKSHLNIAQRTIIQNYLSAKYAITLSTDDLYDEDNNGYDYEVAGIGQASDGSNHLDAQGSGIVRINTPSGLGNGEYLIWGHDNAAINLTSSDLPTDLGARLSRVWRASETGEVGTVTISFDLSALSGSYITSNLRLIIDSDNDGLFNDESGASVISGATNTSGSIYEWTGVDIDDNQRFTIGVLALGYLGPGGVGDIDGTGTLEIWLRADDLDGDNDFTDNPADASLVSTWADYSGNSNDFTQSGTNRPTYSSSGSYNAVNFDATSTDPQYMNATSTGSYTDGSAFFATNAGDAGNNSVLFDNTSFSLRVEQWANTGVAGFTRYGIADYNTSISSVFGSNAIYSFHKEASSTNIDIRVNGGAESLNVGSSAAGIPYDRIGQNSSPDNEVNGDFYEVILYSSELNDAQLAIVDNYLSAKYGGITISSDLYDEDDGGNGDFDFDVAGIGQASDGTNHLDAQGTGIVRVNTASALGNNEYFIWGHNNDILSSFGVTDLPTGVESRLDREWRASETGEVGTLTISFDLAGVFGSIAASDLRLLIDSDNDGVFNDESGASVVSGAVNTSGDIFEWTGVDIDNNQRFTIGSVDAISTPLPIELIDFQAKKTKGNNVLLSWQTATDLNNDYFALERSVDGRNWIELEKIKGAGNSTTTLDYNYVDTRPNQGQNYYRLCQFDFDGSREEFNEKIRRVNFEIRDIEFRLYPNPNRGNILTVELLAPQRGKYTLEILSSKGIVAIDKIFVVEDEFIAKQFELDLLNLKSGIYFVRLTNNQTTFTRKLIIKG